MRANLGEPVEVWLRDGTPARFIWRGRRYTVMFVLDRHFVPAAPLASPDAPPVSPDAPPVSPDVPPVRADVPPVSQDAPSAEPTVDLGVAGTGAGNDCWRVEATPERTLPPARYELCHDLAADRWLLSRD
jgi:hypothetical protein